MKRLNLSRPPLVGLLVVSCLIFGSFAFFRASRAQIGGAASVSLEPAGTKAPAFDPCALISNAEIALVQGAAVQQSQPSRYPYGDLDISQCYYTAITRDGKNLSVHLQVIQPSSKSARRDAVGEFWKARFSQAKKDNDAKEEKEREEEDSPKAPISIQGIGDEAFWLASNRGGALFVKRSDQLVRVSVGGSDDAKTKIAKSKTLAKKALARLK